MKKRTGILIVIMTVLLLVTMLWAYGRMCDSRAVTLAAQTDLGECRNVAAKIQRYRHQPTVALQHERLSAEITGMVEAAANSAGIAADKLIRITPEPPRRLEDTVYKEKPTNVLLKDVALKQLVVLLHDLLSAEKGLNDDWLRITASRRDDTGDLWSAEFVVTHLIYDPPRLNK